VTEPFTHYKANRRRSGGMEGPRGFRGRPGLIGQQVESTLPEGYAEVRGSRGRPGHLTLLHELHEVAHLWSTSVYRSFESADDFKTEVALLRTVAIRASA